RRRLWCRFPSWRCCLGSFTSGRHLLSSESFYFCVCLRFISSASSGLCLVVGFSSLADDLLPFQSGGCFAAVIALVEVCFGRMLCRCGLLIGWMLCHLC